MQLTPRLAASMICAAVLIVLTGCAGEEPALEPTVSASPAPTLTEKSTPTPTLTPTPDPVSMIPTSCDELVDTGNYEYPTLVSEQQDRLEAGVFGPATDAAFASGSPVTCLYYIPNSDGGAVVAASVISESEIEMLVEAFRGSVYEDVSADYPASELAYHRGMSDDHRQTTVVLIDGDVLVGQSGTLAEPFVAETLDSIKRSSGR